MTTPGIQAAINAAGAAGGGIVQLPAGVLDANVEKKLPYLTINQPRVYIRGAGKGADGTLLVNHRYSDTPDPQAPWHAGEHPLIVCGNAPDEFDLQEMPPLCGITAGKRGSAIITVTESHSLRVGQHVLLRQLEDDQGSLALDLVQH
jgi:hypothetical protein